MDEVLGRGAPSLALDLPSRMRPSVGRTDSLFVASADSKLEKARGFKLRVGLDLSGLLRLRRESRAEIEVSEESSDSESTSVFERRVC